MCLSTKKNTWFIVSGRNFRTVFNTTKDQILQYCFVSHGSNKHNRPWTCSCLFVSGCREIRSVSTRCRRSEPWSLTCGNPRFILVTGRPRITLGGGSDSWDLPDTQPPLQRRIESRACRKSNSRRKQQDKENTSRLGMGNFR